MYVNEGTRFFLEICLGDFFPLQIKGNKSFSLVLIVDMSRSINECVKRKKILIIFSSFHHIEFIISFPSKLGTKPDESRAHILWRTLQMLEWKEILNLLLCHQLLNVPASGSNFVDSYRRSWACNGWTWIFDGFTNSSISVRSTSLEIVSCSCFDAVWLWLWLWCVDEDVSVCCTVSISNSVRFTPKQADEQEKNR